MSVDQTGAGDAGSRPATTGREGLDLTRTGVTIVFYALELMALSVLLVVAGALLRKPYPALQGAIDSYVNVFPYLILLSGWMAMAGRALCLTAPARVGGRGLIIGALVCDLTPTIIQILTYVNPELLLKMFLRRPIMLTLSPVLASLLGTALFLLFLRQLAAYISERDIAAMAIRVLVLLLIVVGLVLLPIYGGFTEPMAVVGMFFLAVIFGLLWLARYSRLLLRTKVALISEPVS